MINKISTMISLAYNIFLNYVLSLTVEVNQAVVGVKFIKSMIRVGENCLLF